MPSAHEIRVGTVINGDFYISDKLESPTPYTTVRDSARGYNVLRVDWEKHELDMPTKERMLIMDNLRLLAEIKYNQLKDNDGATI